MGCNSIKNNLSKDDIISDIKLCLGADIYRENVFVLAEGAGDVSFLRKFLSENVLLYESYDGKIGVEVIVNEVFGEYINVIGIRDKDYEIGNSGEKIFKYDYCCLEMMIISNDDVFESVCSEYYNGKENHIVLRMHILKELRLLSVLRMLSSGNGWNLIFRGLSISKALNKDKEKLNYGDLLYELNNRNRGFLSRYATELIGHNWAKEFRYEELLDVTQGHDFSMLFTALCEINKEASIKSVKYDVIEGSLRCGFRKEDFSKTGLYKHILDYGGRYNLNILCC